MAATGTERDGCARLFTLAELQTSALEFLKSSNASPAATFCSNCLQSAPNLRLRSYIFYSISQEKSAN